MTADETHSDPAESAALLEQIEPRPGANSPKSDEIVTTEPARPAPSTPSDPAAPGRGPGAKGSNGTTGSNGRTGSNGTGAGHTGTDPTWDPTDDPAIDLGFASATREATPPRHDWERRLLVAVVVADVAAVLMAVLISWCLRGRAAEVHSSFSAWGMHIPYLWPAVLAIPIWLLSLAVGGAYDLSLLGDSAVEYSKVATVAAALLTVVCAVSFVGSIFLSRSLIAIFFPALLVFAVLNRYIVRKSLHRRRRRGEALRQIVAVGDPDAVAHLAEHLRRMAYAGYRVVAAYLPAGSDHDPALAHHSFPPVRGEPDQLVADLDRMEVDAIAVTGHGLFETESLRSLAWRLHGTGIQLLMAPDLVDIAGPAYRVAAGRRPAHAVGRGAPDRRPGPDGQVLHRAGAGPGRRRGHPAGGAGPGPVGQADQSGAGVVPPGPGRSRRQALRDAEVPFDGRRGRQPAS